MNDQSSDMDTPAPTERDPVTVPQEWEKPELEKIPVSHTESGFNAGADGFYS